MKIYLLQYEPTKNLFGSLLFKSISKMEFKNNVLCFTRNCSLLFYQFIWTTRIEKLLWVSIIRKNPPFPV